LLPLEFWGLGTGFSVACRICFNFWSRAPMDTELSLEFARLRLLPSIDTSLHPWTPFFPTLGRRFWVLNWLLPYFLPCA
jgi:hypothetical protein